MAVARQQMTLGEYLVREGIITPAQFNNAQNKQKTTHHSIGRILVDLNLITESMRMEILTKQFGFEVINLDDVQVESSLFGMIPHSYAEANRVVPVYQQPNSTLVIAMEDPSDIVTLDAIKKMVGLPLKPYVASREDIQKVLQQYPKARTASGAGPAPEEREPSQIYRILRYSAAPVLMCLPILFLIWAIYADFAGIATWMQVQLQEELMSRWDIALYIALIWGLWVVIVYEINGLVFPENREV